MVDDFEICSNFFNIFLIAVDCYSTWVSELWHFSGLRRAKQAKWTVAYWRCVGWLMLIWNIIIAIFSCDVAVDLTNVLTWSCIELLRLKIMEAQKLDYGTVFKESCTVHELEWDKYGMCLDHILGWVYIIIRSIGAQWRIIFKFVPAFSVTALMHWDAIEGGIMD